MHRIVPPRSERGAVAVIVAILIVPLILFAAVSVDVAGVYSVRQRLRTGADAAALAIAQDCAHNNCGSPGATAATLAQANLVTGTASTTVSSVTPTTGTVTVTASSTHNNAFATLIGHPTTAVSASATATWGSPSGGTAMLPLVFSWCEWKAQTGGGYPSGTTPTTIYLTKSSSTGCTGPSGTLVPGGFGWVDSATGCTATSSINQTVSSSTGNTPPSGCSASSFAALQNATVLLPVFDKYTGTGTNAYYTVYAYAAFKLTGYYFAGTYKWNNPCSGSDRCIRGYFTGLVSLDTTFTYSATAPQLGGSVVVLTA